MNTRNAMNDTQISPKIAYPKLDVKPMTLEDWIKSCSNGDELLVIKIKSDDGPGLALMSKETNEMFMVEL